MSSVYIGKARNVERWTGKAKEPNYFCTVSYTHLTLPTKRIV